MSSRSTSRPHEPLAAPLRADGFARELVNVLLPLYVMLITAGYFIFRSGATMLRGNELSGDRALFSAVNAATLTGLQISVGPDQFLQRGQVALFVITLLATMLTLFISSAAVVRLVKLPYSDFTLLAWSAGTCIAAPLLGLAFLSTPDRPPLHAAFLALSAFANSGLHFGPLPAVASWQTQMLLLPLATLGGIGLPVLLELVDRFLGRRPHLSLYARLVLSLTGGVIILATTCLFMAMQHAAGPGAPDDLWRTHLGSALALAVDSRTNGLNFQLAGSLPRYAQWIMMAVMLIGASAAGTGGGLKTNTLAVLFRGVFRALRGDAPGRMFGIAIVWLLILAGTFAAAMLALLATEPQSPADRLMFDLASALSNAGASTDILSTVGPGLYILAGAMFVGRFAPLLILWWAVDTVESTDLPAG